MGQGVIGFRSGRTNVVCERRLSPTGLPMYLATKVVHHRTLAFAQVLYLLKLALFLFITNVIMLFIVEPFSAEFVITVISAALMLILVAAVVIGRRIKERKEQSKEIKKDE